MRINLSPRETLLVLPNKMAVTTTNYNTNERKKLLIRPNSDGVVTKKESWNSATNIQVHLTILLFLILHLTLPALGFFIDEKQSPARHDWSYGSQQDWQLEHKECGQNVQSPIDIQRRYVISNNQLNLRFYNYNQLTRFKISNAHHTIKLDPIDLNQQDTFGFKLRPPNGDDGFNASLPDIMTADESPELEPEYETKSVNTGRNNHQSRLKFGNNQTHTQQQQQQTSNSQHFHSSENNHLDNNPNNMMPNEDGAINNPNSLDHKPYDGAPTIKLDWMDDGNNEYKLRDIHFHWGERRDNGSEHAIDGKRAAMEMHLVHIKHGMDKSKLGFTSDSVTVIAVLIESYRKSNADFNPIVSALSRINMTNESQEIEYKSLNDLLPNILNSFYTYSGSLTTPPCYQVVNWIVMSDRLYLNAKQIEMFRNLYAPPTDGGEHHGATELGQPAEPKLIMPNIRQIQPLNNRTILASFSPLSRLEQIQVGNSPYPASSAHPNYYHLNNIFQLGSLLLCTLILNNLLIMTQRQHSPTVVHHCTNTAPRR